MQAAKERRAGKINTEIGKYLVSTVLGQLKAGHSQPAKRLNKGYTQLQAEEQDEVDKKAHQVTGEVTTVVEDVLVIGIGNYDSVTK